MKKYLVFVLYVCLLYMSVVHTANFLKRLVRILSCYACCPVTRVDDTRIIGVGSTTYGTTHNIALNSVDSSTPSTFSEITLSSSSEE